MLPLSPRRLDLLRLWQPLAPVMDPADLCVEGQLTTAGPNPHRAFLDVSSCADPDVRLSAQSGTEWLSGRVLLVHVFARPDASRLLVVPHLLLTPRLVDEALFRLACHRIAMLPSRA